jgi:hypothetical protein
VVLFIIYMYPEYGCPNNNISDHSIEFISCFTCTLRETCISIPPLVIILKPHCMLQQNMAATQDYQLWYTNIDCLPAPEFPIWSQAYVHAEFFRVTHPSKNFSDQMARPFEVIDKPRTHSYTLCLPVMSCTSLLHNQSRLAYSSDRAIQFHHQSAYMPLYFSETCLSLP